MGLTISDLTRGVAGNRREYSAVVTFDASYPTGGESLRAWDLGLDQLHNLQADSSGGYVFSYDYANSKLKAFFAPGSAASGTITGTAAAQSISLTDGSRVITYTPQVPLAAANTSQKAADQASAPTNPTILLAGTVVSTLAPTYVITPTAQPDVPRNICIVIENASGGPLDLYEGSTTYAISGKFQNQNVSEALTWISTGGNKTVADTKFRYAYSQQAFDSVTSITITNPPAGALKVSVGVGASLGLPWPMDTQTAADIISIYVGGTSAAPYTGLNTAFQFYDFGTINSSDDITIVYKGDYDAAANPTASTSSVTGTFSGTGTAAALSEVTAGTNLSAVSTYVVAIGI